MQLFDLPQARHFCAAFPAPASGTEQSLADFHMAHGTVTVLKEGTPLFEVHRVNLLMSAERWLVFSVGHYRRALEMLVPATAPWAQVTLYYSSFFAANALLAMFGAWIGQTVKGVRVVDVAQGQVTNQELRINRKVSTGPSGARGSHRIFWDFFYDSIPILTAWVPPKLAPALTPVNGDYGWQIAVRNEVNYDMFHAWTAARSFYGSFKPARLKTLSGPLAQQRDSTEQLLRLALHFARDVGLSASALSDCGFTGDRLSNLRRLVKQQAPAVLNQSEFVNFVA